MWLVRKMDGERVEWSREESGVGRSGEWSREERGEQEAEEGQKRGEVRRRERGRYEG